MVAGPNWRLGNRFGSQAAARGGRGWAPPWEDALRGSARAARRFGWAQLMALFCLGAVGTANAQFEPPPLPSPSHPVPQAVQTPPNPASQFPSYPAAQHAPVQGQPGAVTPQFPAVPSSQPLAGQVYAAPPGPVPAPPSDMVVDVRVVGNKQTPTEKLMRYIQTRPGRPYSAESVGKDVRRLNSSGLVVSVRPQYQQAPNGQGRIVVYEVFERATIRSVHYVGNRKIKKKTLSKEAKLKAGDPLEPFAIEESRSRLEAFYKEKGYPDARVTLSEGSKPTDERVVFVVNEGAKQTILWASFEGNEIVDDARLRTKIKSKQGVLWLLGGELNRKQIDADKELLEEYFHGLGFFRARIGCLVEEHSVSDQRDWISLKFVIDEGPRYAIRNLSVVGNKRVDTPELLRVIELETGQFFRQDDMRRDQNAIKDRYGAVGHIFADVKPEIRFLEEPGQLDLIYQIDEGERYRVGKIDVDIAGDYPHTQITTVLNRLSLEPGDIIDIRELRDSQRRLRSSQLFKADPQSGVMPEIAFSPPTPEEIEKAKAMFARRQTQAGEFRGQNPQGTLHTVLRQPPVANGDRWYNLSIGTSPAPQPARPQPEYAAPQTSAPTAPPSTGYVNRGQSPNSPNMSRFLSPARQPGDVMRFQYTADGGSSTPPLPPVGTTPDFYATPTPGPAPSIAPGPAPSMAPPANAYGNPYAPPPGAIAPNGEYIPGAQLPPPGAFGGYGGPIPNEPGLNYFGDRDPGGFLGSVPHEEPAIFLPLRPEVAETETGRFMFSAGVNSDAGVVGSIVVDEQNFDWRRFPRGWDDIRNGTAWRGRGQRFRLEAMPGSEVQRYMVTFNEPYLFDSQVGLGLNGFYYTRFYQEWDEQRIGGRVTLGYKLAHDLSASAAFRMARVTLSDPIVGAPPDLLDAVGDSDLYGFRGQLTHDTRDNTFLPTEGHLLTLGFEQVMGTYQYPRADFDLRKYFMLHERPDSSGRHVVGLKTTVGYTGSDTPIYEHFFNGGFSTIRGFDFRGASPRVNGVPVGGEFNLLASAEYMFPLTASDTVRGVVFCDSGAAQPSIDNWEDKYRVAPGFGLRLTIPAMGPAPIALDFAFPVVSEDGDEKEVFSFFIGFLK